MSLSKSIFIAISFWSVLGIGSLLAQPSVVPDTIRLNFGYTPASEYELVNDKDGKRVEIGHSGDMGMKFMQYYALRPDVEDGEYVIYVNDTLGSRCFVKNKQRVGSWKTYNSNGKVESETPYEDGLKNGVQKWYDRTGEINGLVIFGMDTSYADVFFYPSGPIESMHFACYLHHYFDEQGYITSLKKWGSDDPSTRDCRFLESEEQLKAGVFDGISEYRYGGVKFKLEFNEGVLKTLSFERNGGVILDDFQIGY